MRIECDTRYFHHAMRDYQAAMRKDMREVIRQQAKLFVRDILGLMHPKSGPKGRKNVARDIARVFKDPRKLGADALAHSLIANTDEAFALAATYDSRRIASRIRHLATEGNHRVLSAVLARVGPKAKIHLPEAATVSPKLHKDAIRRGSVPDWHKGYAYTGRTSDLARYIKVVQARVGNAKGGWGECAARLGVTLPAFVRAKAAGRGSCLIDENPDAPSITLINRDPAAVAQDSQFNISARAYDKRVNSIYAVLDRIAKRNAERASK